MNVLIKDDGVACLCDFGLSVMTSEVYGLSFLSSKLGGAAHWAAPEIVLFGDSEEDVAQSPPLSFHSDIYSFGCIVVEVGFAIVHCDIILTDNVLDQVMTGKLPWGTLRPQAVVVKLMRKERPRRPTSTMLTDKIWEYVDTKCWALTPDERPSANEVEIFINDLYDLSQRVIHCDPLHEL